MSKKRWIVVTGMAVAVAGASRILPDTAAEHGRNMAQLQRTSRA